MPLMAKVVSCHEFSSGGFAPQVGRIDPPSHFLKADLVGEGAKGRYTTNVIAQIKMAAARYSQKV